MTKGRFENVGIVRVESKVLESPCPCTPLPRGRRRVREVPTRTTQLPRREPQGPRWAGAAGADRYGPGMIRVPIGTPLPLDEGAAQEEHVRGPLREPAHEISVPVRTIRKPRCACGAPD